jgi:HKD family nuclease
MAPGQIRALIQPGGSTLDEIENHLAAGKVRGVDIAVAYITASGLTTFLEAVDRIAPSVISSPNTRWVTSFDYFRTDPAALSQLLALRPNNVRVHEGVSGLTRKCVPRVPFHPKVFIVNYEVGRAIVAGSGNMSYSGLRRGHEAGFSIATSSGASKLDSQLRNAARSYAGWYSRLWSGSDQLTPTILRRYQGMYDLASHLRVPALTDDDTVPQSEVARGLALADLSKMRACRRMWIEAGNISKNRGPTLPGNQLMMKRMSRVFFGVHAIDVPPDTHLKYLDVAYNGGAWRTCSLSYSNNKMDKLTLPIPGVDGPSQYDGHTLLIERLTPSKFSVKILSTAAKASAVAASSNIGAAFAMNGGRRWGVF